ncbi:MAG: hypothetical protein HFF90_02185 [Oscillibacter sp.]|nr:hypothetical protein [Oscillibacter sp.]
MEFSESFVENFIKTSGPLILFSGEDARALAEAMCRDAAARALREIRVVLDNEALDDPACFRKIEEIVSVYESLGLDGGSRHDFG